MLNTLRKKINSTFSIIFVLLLAASFAFWGVGDIFSSKNNPALATVDNQEVTANEFITTYKRILSELNKNTQGQITEEVARSIGLPRQTLAQLINEKIIDIEVNKANIILPDEYLKKLIQSSNLFKDQFGSFSKQQFEYVLRQLGMEDKTYFNEIRKSILRDQIRATFSYKNDITPIIENIYYNIRNENRSIKTVNISASAFKNDAIPKNSEIQNKLNTDKELYMKPEFRSFTLVSLKPDDLLMDININEEDIIAEYNNYPEKYNISEKREVFLINLQDDQIANNFVRKINNSNNSSDLKENFIKAVVNETKQDSDSINLGLIEYNDLPPEVSDSVFKAELNKLVGPEKTPFGWRVFLINKIEAEIITKYEDVKIQIEKELKVNVALEKMYDLGNIFYDEIASGNQIQEAALSINASIIEFNHTDVNGMDLNGNIVNDLPPYPNILKTVFSTNVNNTSELISTIGNTMYAIQVNDIIYEQTMTIDEAKDKIIKDIQFIKSMEMALNTANNFIREADSGDFEKIAKKYNLIVLDSKNVQKNGRGSEGVLNQEALNLVFHIKKGKITQPIKYNDNTYIVAKVENILPIKDVNSEKLIEINSSISKDIAKDIQELFMNNLTNNHKIKINDRLLDSLFLNNS